MDVSFLKDLSIIFGLSLCVAYLCSRVRVPVIVGFLVTGVLVGPHGLQLVSAVEQVEVMSEAGIVLLLFTIGLELSIKELLQLKKAVFLGGTTQIMLTIAIFAILAYGFGLPVNISIFAGFIGCLSSTAIVLKILQERAAMDSPVGRITLGIMIFQDLSIVPMMLLIPVLAGTNAGDNQGVAALLYAFGVKFGIFLALIIAARFLIPRILGLIARTRNREIFLLATFAICLTITLVTAYIGLSLALGAFLAGLFIAESQYSLSALEGILPFRDIFTSLFFISVGMLLDASYFFSHIGEVLVLTAVIILIKTLTGSAATAILRYPIRPVIMVGMGLAQIGEFSLVLAKEGLVQQLLTNSHYQLFLAATILTMAITPFWMAFSPAAADWVAHRSFFRRREEEVLPPPPPAQLPGEETAITQVGEAKGQPASQGEAPVHPSALKDHLIIIGFGIGGKHLARAAAMANIPYVVLEMNPDTVRKYAKLGIPIMYGDASNRAVLEHIGVHEARAMAVVISDPLAIRRVTDIARKLNSSLYIIVRTRFMGEREDLRQLGADAVIVEEFEASIEVFHHVLARYLVPLEEIQRFTTEVRAEGYDMLRAIDKAKNPFDSIRKHISTVQLSTVQVEYHSPLEGKTLMDSGLRNDYGLIVVAIRRDDDIFINPDPAFHFSAGDSVSIFGDHKAILKAAHLFKTPEEPAA